MASFTRTSGFTAVAALAVVAFLLTGCSSDSDGAGTQTLASTKSPVQLLRNEAASRIPPAVIDNVTQSGDLSIGCKSKADDPKGILRSWRSSAQVTIVAGSAWRVDTVTDDIVQSFVDQGWVAKPLEGSPTSHEVLLSSKTSPAEIQLSANRPDPTAAPSTAVELATTVTIDLSVHGPCVKTEGADSSAVKKLEGRK